jgi:hypothetical protein
VRLRLAQFTSFDHRRSGCTSPLRSEYWVRLVRIDHPRWLRFANLARHWLWPRNSSTAKDNGLGHLPRDRSPVGFVRRVFMTRGGLVLRILAARVGFDRRVVTTPVGFVRRIAAACVAFTRRVSLCRGSLASRCTSPRLLLTDRCPLASFGGQSRPALASFGALGSTTSLTLQRTTDYPSISF